MELSIGPITTIVWIINFILLFLLILVSTLVFRNARKHNMSIVSALAWAVVSLFTFPIGTLIYLFLGREKT
jgi:hypothetical protein